MAAPNPIAQAYTELDSLSRQRYGIPAPVLLAKLEKGESGNSANATSSAGARKWFQFMPGTRQAVVKQYGIDPWRSEQEARDAAVLHLTGKLGNAKGLEGYNPGGGQQYVQYILDQKVGKNSLQAKVGNALSPATPSAPATSSSGVDNKSLALSLLGFGSGGNDPSDPLTMALQGAQQSAKPVGQTPSYSPTASTSAVGGAISKQSLGRIDQGVDFTGTGPVPAHGDAVVTRVVQHGGPSGWPGGGFVVYKLTSGPAKGRFIYVAENIAPKVKVGQRLKTGQTVAVALGGSPYLETGWAANAQGQTLARNKGHADLHPNRSNTPEGHDFLRFLGLG